MKSSQIQIPSNYILVKLDTGFEFYHLDGKETKLTVSNREEDHAHHIPISGTVIGLPNHLVYNGDYLLKNDMDYQESINRFMAIGEGEALNVEPSKLREYSQLKNESVRFNVPIEVVVGDKVFFQYMSNYEAVEIGGFVDTEDLGMLHMMKYDNLIICQKISGKVFPVNGYLVVEPLSADTTMVDNILEFTGLSKKGLMKQAVQGTKWLGTRRWQLGVVKLVSKPCAGYLDFLSFGPDITTVVEDKLILYNKSFSVAFQSHYHQNLFRGTKVARIHRKDIFYTFEGNEKLLKQQFTKELWEN